AATSVRSGSRVGAAMELHTVGLVVDIGPPLGVVDQSKPPDGGNRNLASRGPPCRRARHFSPRPLALGATSSSHTFDEAPSKPPFDDASLAIFCIPKGSFPQDGSSRASE